MLIYYQYGWNINISTVDAFIMPNRTYLCYFCTFIDDLHHFPRFSISQVDIDAHLCPICLDFNNISNLDLFIMPNRIYLCAFFVHWHVVVCQLLWKIYKYAFHMVFY